MLRLFVALSTCSLALVWLLTPFTLTAASRDATDSNAEVLIPDVPHVLQEPDFCGEACAEMALRKLGYDITQEDVFNVSEVDPSLGRGVHTAELARGLRSLGFEVGGVWHKTQGRSVAEAEVDEWTALLTDLRAAVPSIVCMQYDDTPHTTEHFRLILGYSAATDEVIFNEPAEANGAYEHMPRARFLKLWPIATRSGMVLIRLRLDARSVRLPERSRKPTAAALAQHVMALREKLPGPGFSIVLVPPFVVIGDESPSVVRERADGVVRWTMDRLKKDFFAEDPTEILDVWVFKNRTSYLKNTWTLFHERPDTPFGYYSDTHHALVMNIGPGAGTLVHELVHPYMEANFAHYPPWLNEGLASLYERPSEDATGHIRGLVNWRLPVLQEAVKNNRVPALRALMSMNEATFYGDDSDINYAAARYLCYYLQEHGQLVAFVRALQDNLDKDGTGFDTLVDLLGITDAKAFDQTFRDFALRLKSR